MSLIKQLAGETVLYGIGQILPRIFHFLVFTFYLTNRLNDSPVEYDIYLTMYAYASILIVIFSYRMDTAFFRFGNKQEQMDGVFYTALLPLLGTSVVLLIIGTMFSSTIATWLTIEGREYYVTWFSIIIALDVLALLPMARLRLENKAKIFVTFKVGNVLITVLLVLLFLEIIPRFAPEYLSQNFPSFTSDIDYVFISNIVASAVMLIGLIWLYPIKFGKINWPLWRKMVSFAWPLIIVGIAGSINQFFGVPLQNIYLGEDTDLNKEQAAIYGAVQKIPALLAMFTTAYNYASEPFFFKNADRSDAKNLYGDIALFFIMVAGVGVLSIYLYLDILQYLLGSTYRQGLYLVPILLLSYLFLGIYYNISIWYKLSDNTKYGAMVATLGAIITIAASIIFLPIIGVSASAYAALACYFTMVIVAYLLGQKKYPISYPLYSMIRIIVLIIGLMLAGWFFKSENHLINIVTATTLIAVYLGACYMLEKEKLRIYLII